MGLRRPRRLTPPLVRCQSLEPPLFTERLTLQEREALVVLLAFMAATDGEVRHEEREFVTARCEELDVNGDPFDRIGDISLLELCDAFKTSENRRIALIELVKAAQVDGEYHSSEARSIRVIAELLEVDEGTVDALESWVQTGFAWREQGEALVTG